MVLRRHNEIEILDKSMDHGMRVERCLQSIPRYSDQVVPFDHILVMSSLLHTDSFTRAHHPSSRHLMVLVDVIKR